MSTGVAHTDLQIESSMRKADMNAVSSEALVQDIPLSNLLH